MSEIDFAFEGGGAKGIVFAGALLELARRSQLTPGRLLGTSAGAISAALLAAGYTPQEMLVALQERDADDKPVFVGFLGEPAPFDEAAIRNSAIRRLLNDIDIPLLPNTAEQRADDWIAARLAAHPFGRHLFAFVERGGWYAADRFVAWFKRMLDSGEFNGAPRAFSGMTMAEFHAATGKELTLVAADTTAQRMLLLNHRTAPDLPVVYATRMSMSVPLLWEEVIWQEGWGDYHTWDAQTGALKAAPMAGAEIVDGGLLSNFPIALLMSDRPDVNAVMGPPKTKNVLGLLIDETLPVPNRPERPASGSGGLAAALGGSRTAGRLQRLLNTATCAHDNLAKAVFADNVVRLPAGGYGTTQFDMTDEERAALLAAGQQAMAAFLSTQTVLESAGEELAFPVSAGMLSAANSAAAAILAP